MNLSRITAGCNTQSISLKKSPKIQRNIISCYKFSKNIPTYSRIIERYLKDNTWNSIGFVNSVSSNILGRRRGSWTNTLLQHRLSSSSTKIRNDKTNWRYRSSTWFTNTTSIVKGIRGTNAVRSSTTYNGRSLWIRKCWGYIKRRNLYSAQDPCFNAKGKRTKLRKL